MSRAIGDRSGVDPHRPGAERRGVVGILGHPLQLGLVPGDEQISAAVHPEAVPGLTGHPLEDVDRAVHQLDHGEVGPPVPVTLGGLVRRQRQWWPGVDDDHPGRFQRQRQVIGGGDPADPGSDHHHIRGVGHQVPRNSRTRSAMASAVNPSFSASTVSGAEAPNRSIPIFRPPVADDPLPSEGGGGLDRHPRRRAEHLLAIGLVLFEEELPAGQAHDAGLDTVAGEGLCGTQGRGDLGPGGDQRHRVPFPDHVPASGHSTRYRVESGEVLPGQDQGHRAVVAVQGDLPGLQRLVGVGGADHPDIRASHAARPGARSADGSARPHRGRPSRGCTPRSRARP